MATGGLEVRMAGLEGAYEQIYNRLGSIEGRMASLERKLDDGFSRLRAAIDTNFRWVVGVVLVNWVTVMLGILLHR